jgi:hypothetical protein
MKLNDADKAIWANAFAICFLHGGNNDRACSYADHVLERATERATKGVLYPKEKSVDEL